MQNQNVPVATRPSPSPSSHLHHNSTSTSTSTSYSAQSRTMQQSMFDDDFVTVDAADDESSMSNQSSNQYKYNYHPASDTKNHHLSISKTSSSLYGHQIDVLSLLLSSITAPPPAASASPQQHDDIIQGSEEGIKTNGMMHLCEEASKSATEASKSTREGKIADAVNHHVRAAKCYRDAAVFLRREHKNDLSLLAYSLLVLSNAQARSADSLVKHGGVNVSTGVITSASAGANAVTGAGAASGDLNGKRGDSDSFEAGGSSKGNGSSGGGGSKEMKRPTAKEDRLRAKIRASMNTAEADMTDSTFLGRATNHASGHGIARGRQGQGQVQGQGQGHQVMPNGVVDHTSMASDPAPIQGAKSSINPVDDMMELEQELRDMDATLDMGVNLSASTTSIATKTSLADGSFCVVPGAGGSSYMSSSMMWASGIGGRPTYPQQHPQQHHQNHLGGNNARARANRVQTILGASSAGVHKSPSIGGHQQLHQPHHLNPNVAAPKHHAGLESSWWGQASALASSTTSLSNSMVGIRSANVGANHMNRDASMAPANTKQLMRLLDSLKTLGDENTSLLREVDDAKKARLEAKAARESMRQFKDDYARRFATLKAALDKFRSQYPDQRSNDGAKGPSNNNIVSKSDFIQTKTMMEMQKRDKMIQKLTSDLKAEKADGKKKDDALRKYESFYKEVKARSEQKTRQKEEQKRRQNAEQIRR